MSPLSDRASRDNGDVKGPRLYVLSEGNIEYLLDTQPFRGPRALHVDTVNARNLGEPLGVNRMLNYDIKKDNFKMNITLLKVVRLSHSSGEGR